MVDNYKIEVMKFFTGYLRIEALGFWAGLRLSA